MSDIQVGSVVVLRSGSPRMTVSRIFKHDKHDKVDMCECTYFILKDVWIGPFAAVTSVDSLVVDEPTKTWASPVTDCTFEVGGSVNWTPGAIKTSSVTLPEVKKTPICPTVKSSKTK